MQLFDKKHVIVEGIGYWEIGYWLLVSIVSRIYQ